MRIQSNKQTIAGRIKRAGHAPLIRIRSIHGILQLRFPSYSHAGWYSNLTALGTTFRGLKIALFHFFCIDLLRTRMGVVVIRSLGVSSWGREFGSCNNVVCPMPVQGRWKKWLTVGGLSMADCLQNFGGRLMRAVGCIDCRQTVDHF